MNKCSVCGATVPTHEISGFAAGSEQTKQIHICNTCAAGAGILASADHIDMDALRGVLILALESRQIWSNDE
jgi:protein-arginine kinase activator protein McsA